MQAHQSIWTAARGWEDTVAVPASVPRPHASLVLVFGSVTRLRDAEVMGALRERWPGARIVGCSTAGEIAGIHVFDDSLVATALQFDSTTVQLAEARLDAATGSRGLGETLARAVLAVLVMAALSACATRPADPAARAAFDENNDRLEPFNRFTVAGASAVEMAERELDHVIHPVEPAALQRESCGSAPGGRSLAHGRQRARKAQRPDGQCFRAVADRE